MIIRNSHHTLGCWLHLQKLVHGIAKFFGTVRLVNFLVSGNYNELVYVSKTNKHITGEPHLVYMVGI